MINSAKNLTYIKLGFFDGRMHTDWCKRKECKMHRVKEHHAQAVLILLESGRIKMLSKYFTKTEADSKIGKKIETLVNFYEVPKGTVGTVYESYEADGGYGIMIHWDLQESIDDGFSKDEYVEFLKEV